MNQFFQESLVKNINISHNHTKMKSLVVIILAAGNGTRMNSPLPKVLHSICGRPMIVRIVETALQLSPKKIVLVTGKHDQLIRGTVFSHLPESRKIVNVVVQTSPRGTGDAVKQTLPLFWPDDRVLILNGDMPLITRAILERFLNVRIVPSTTYWSPDSKNLPGMDVLFYVTMIVKKYNRLSRRRIVRRNSAP